MSTTGSGTGSATDSLLADLALEGGTYLLRQGIQRGILGQALPPGKAARKGKRRGLGSALVHGALLRLATRSVPGAILIGGGLLAKRLHDRRKAAKARSPAASPTQGGDDSGKQA